MKRFIAAACVVIGLTLSVAAAAQELRVAIVEAQLAKLRE